MDVEERLAVLWLNSCVDVPAALLVSRLEELRDGAVLGAVVANVRRRFEAFMGGGARAGASSSLESGLHWLVTSFRDDCGRHGLGDAPALAAAVRAGDRASTLRLLALVRQLNEDAHALPAGGAHAAAPSGGADGALNFTAALGDVSILSAMSRERGSGARPPPSRRSSTAGGGDHHDGAGSVAPSRSVAHSSPGQQHPQRPAWRSAAAQPPPHPPVAPRSPFAPGHDDGAGSEAGSSYVSGTGGAAVPAVRRRAPAATLARLRVGGDAAAPSGVRQHTGVVDDSVYDAGEQQDGGGAGGGRMNITAWAPPQQQHLRRAAAPTAAAVVPARRRPAAPTAAGAPAAALAPSVAAAPAERRWNISTAVEQPAARPSLAVHASRAAAIAQLPASAATSGSGGGGPSRRASLAQPVPASASAAAGGGRGLLVGGIYDPTYAPRVVVLAPGAAATAAGGASTAASSPARSPLHTSPARSPVARQPQQQHASPLPLPEPAAGGSRVDPDGLTGRQRVVVAWMRHLGVETDPRRRLALGLGGGGLGGSGRLPPGSGLADALPRALEDGVLLSELLATVEARSYSVVPIVTVPVPVPDASDGSSAIGSAQGTSLRLLTGTTLPRPGYPSLSVSSAERNVHLIVKLLRERPWFSRRRLIAPAETLLQAGRHGEAAWGLLDDLYEGYRRCTEPEAAAAEAVAHVPLAAPARPRSVAPPHTAPRTAPAAAAATPLLPAGVTSPARVLRAARSQQPHRGAPQPPPLPAPVPLPLPQHITALAPQRPQPPPVSAAPSGNKRALRPIAKPVAPPVGTPAPLALAALAAPGSGGSSSAHVRRRDVVQGMDALRGEARDFACALSLGHLLPPLSADGSDSAGAGSGVSALDTPLLNGVLLAELAARLEPDVPPLGGPPDGRQRYYTSPRTLAEARANCEAALAAFRRSPVAACAIPQLSPLRYLPHEMASAEAARVPQCQLWCTEALLQGDADVAWALLWCLARAYTWCAGRGLYILPAGAAELHQLMHARALQQAPSPTSTAAAAAQGTDALALLASLPPQPPSSEHRVAPPSRRTSFAGEGAAVGAALAAEEQEIAAWLAASGLAAPSASSGSAPRTASAPTAAFDALLPAVADGTLLAALAARLTGLPHLPGVMERARTDVVARSNLRKALDALLALPGFASPTAASPGIVSALRRQSRLEVVHLLRDVIDWWQAHAAAEQQQLQQHMLEEEEVPLPQPAQLRRPSTASAAPLLPQPGVQAPRHELVADAAPAAAPAAQPPKPPPASRPRAPSAPPARRESTAAAAPPPLGPFAELVATTLAGGASLADELRALMERFSTDGATAAPSEPLQPPAAGLDADTGATRHTQGLPPPPLATATVDGPAGAHPFSSRSVPVQPAVLASRRLSIASVASRGPPLSAAALLEVAPSQLPPQPQPPVATAPPPPAASTSGADPAAQASDEAASVGAWLASLGLGDAIALAMELGPRSRAAPSFTDGLILAAVVEHCEDRSGLRRTLAGLDRAPKNGAARLANIRRVLEVLRDHRTMPLTHLWSETAIRDGDPAVLRSLLLQIRKAYGQHLVTAGGGGAVAAGGGRALQLGHSGASSLRQQQAASAVSAPPPPRP